MSEYYVSPLGNDAWSGRTEDSAFATIAAAIKAIAADAGGTTYVVGGHYYLNGFGLALTNANSNTTITAYPGTDPVISGGTAIPGSSWSVGADGIWTAQLSSNDIGQLTVDGQRQSLARFPKIVPDDPIRSGWLWAQTLPDGGNPLRQLAYNPTDFPIGQNPTVGQQATVFDANNWSNNVLKIAAVDTTSHVITFDGAATYYIGPGSRYFISGSKPLLDQPGEWYFDHPTGILYFNPPSGFNGAGAVVSGNTNLIDISHADNITISGLTFSDAATNAQNEALINTAAVNVNASSGISITGNHFTNVARGVHIDGKSNGNLVSNNDFSNIWAQSISLASGTSHNRIVHNTIDNSGDVFAAASAVQLNSTSSNIVSNNHIVNVPRSGISAVHLDSTVQLGANVIEHNSILHSGQATDDSGAIYIASPGASSSQPDAIRFNTIDDAGGLGTKNGGFISRQNASAGIYVDVGLIGTKISGNVIQGVTLGGVYLHGSSNNDVHGNIISADQKLSDFNREIDISLVPISGMAMGGNSVHDNTLSSSWSESFANSATEPATDSVGNGSSAGGTAVEADGTSDSSSWLPAINLGPPLSVGAGATAEIGGISGQSVTFEGTTGTLKLEDAVGYTGQISGLAGSDAIDLADVNYGPSTQVTFLGNTDEGTLTVTDGTQTANIALVGDYLSSSWTLSSDGSGGTAVVDPVSTNTWQALPIGAGGFIDGMSISDDGVIVVRTDTYGAYLWNGTEWQQLVTATSMPAGFVANSQLYNDGVYEIQVAPNDSNVMYMVYSVYESNTYPALGGVYKSTNEGATWTLTSFSPLDFNDDGPYRGWGQKMAIDPNNPNIVYVGTGANGLFVTTDGGNTWSNVSSVPAGISDGNGQYPGITGILFDPANTNIVYAASYGNGVYETTNGGASWAKLSGGPGSVMFAAISSNGTYFAIDSSNHLWVDAGGTWTEALSSVTGVAVDPFNPNHIVATQSDGQLDESFNSGGSWSGWSSVPTVVSNDIPWLSAIGGVGADGLQFDQTTPGVLYINGNRGVWTTTLSGNITTSTAPTWTDQSIGIEQLVANEIIVPPVANSTPIVASWDSAVFTPNGSTYASTFGPVAGPGVVAGWSIDYASSDPNFIVVLADGGYAGGPQESGYSTNDGQTWTAFPTLPPGGSFGGNIAASTPENIIFADADGSQPYFTLNGGETWNPISLPGVSSWSNFMAAYFDDTRVITADRVLPNTFYLLYGGIGIFETTNGGVTWTLENNSSSLLIDNGASVQLESTPGEAGDLWLASGPGGNAGNQGTGGVLLHSTNGGATWTTIANVSEPYAIGFGAAAPGQSYPAIYMVGWVNNVYGIWQSINEAQSWTQIGTFPNGSLDQIKTISGDPNVFGKVYVGFAGSGYAVFSADGPSVLEITTSPSNGVEQLGAVVTLKLAMSEVATVSGGTPTLTLNDGGTATYVSGSGTDALTFSYTAAAGQNTAALAATALNLNGATIADSGGNAANLSLTGLTQTGPQIDTTPPAVTAVAESHGILEPGATTTLVLNMSEAVTVNTSGGTPTLTLDDGAVATYTGGSGTNALTFSYTVGAGQNTSSLAATAVNLNGGTISNVNGSANLSLSALTQTGPQVDGTSTLAIDGNGFSGSYTSATSANVTLTTANPNDVIILDVAYNGPAIASISDTAGLTWHERAVAGSSGSQIYQYYAIAPNALAADSITVNFAGITSYHAIEALGIVGANTSSPFDTNASVPGTSNGATVSATTSNANDLILATYRFFVSNPTAGSAWNTIDGGSDGYLSEYKILSATQAGLVATASSGENGGIIDAVVAAPITTGPSTVTALVDSPSSGVLRPDAPATLTLNMSEAVTVNTSSGTPTLTLNDGGVATYTGGSGTNALTFSYTVAAGQNTSSLAATAVNLNGGTISNVNGSANLSLSALTQNGPQIDTTAPAAPAITNDTVNANDTVTLNGTTEANSTIHVLNGSDVLGSTTANASGSWSFTTGELTAGSYTFTATATDAAGNTSAVSSGIDPTIGLPAAPAIVSFSPDSGPASADVTNAQILTLTGTAPAASTVAVFDGSTELGATTANAAGAWSYTTGSLAEGAHSFTATDTVAVNVSAASAALTVTVDTIAPAAPQIVNDTVNANDSVTLSGTAAANTTLDVLNGSTELGTTTTNGSGAWSYTTGTLPTGVHSFTATDTDAAGNVSVASAAMTADVGSIAPAVPIIVSDTVSASDTVTLGGTAEADSIVNVFDGSTELGTTTTNGSGAWSYTTGTLGNGVHSFTATDTDAAGTVSAASAAVSADVGSVAPTAPIIVSDTVSANDIVTLGGTAAANSTINVFDGSTELGTTTANGSGAWRYTTDQLANGAHSFTATDVIASEVSAASAALAVTLNSDASTPARNHAGHGWARGSHAPAGKLIDKATLDDIFGTSSTTVSHHAGDLSASDATANTKTDPSENVDPTSHSTFTHTHIFHDATDTNSDGMSNQNNTAVNGSHVIAALDGSPNPHWTGANASADSDATSLLSGSAEAPVEWHPNHSSAWQPGNWVSTDAVSGDIHPPLNAALHSIIFHDATDTSWEGTSNQSNAPDTAVDESHAVSALDGSPPPHWTEANTSADSDATSPPSESAEAPSEWHHDHGSSWLSGNWVATEAVGGDIHPALSAALHSIAAGGASLNFSGLAAEVSDAFVFKSDLGDEPIKHVTTALDRINPHDLFEHIIEIHADLHAAAIENAPEPLDPSTSHVNTLHAHVFHIG